MKKHVFTLFALIFFAGTSCQEKIDIEKEKEAIIKILNEEGKTFAGSDMESLSALHVQDESDTRLAGTKVYSGWNEIETLLKSYIEWNKKDTISENFRNEKENIRLKVTGNTAWVICDNIWKWEAEGEPKGFQNIQINFLEKIDGAWKFSFTAFIPISNVEENKKISTKYHDLNPEDIDDILTDDFIGRHDEYSGFTWNKENHQNYWTNNTGAATDTIYHQIADGNWVATRFQRKMNWQGKDVEVEAMHFKRFENGKIAEIWEYADTKQLE